MLTFVCPYCKDCELKLLERIVCPKCRVDMKSMLVSNIESRVLIDKDNDLCTASTSDGSIVKFISPISLTGELFSSDVYAIFPSQGMSKRSPLLIVFSEDEFLQKHPQLDSLFTRFFVKGLLYSALGNILPFVVFNPPIIIFWISTFAFAGVYYYYSKKIVATGNTAKNLIKAQKTEEKDDTN